MEIWKSSRKLMLFLFELGYFVSRKDAIRGSDEKKKED